MSALADAVRHLDEALESLGTAEPTVPAYAREPFRLARSEAENLRRRLENFRRVMEATLG